MGIIIVCIIILASFSNAIKIQNVKSPTQKKISKQNQQNEFLQAITDFSDKTSSSSPSYLSSSFNDSNSPPRIIANTPSNGSMNQSLTPQTIITIYDPDGDSMIVQWTNNKTGYWQSYGTNASEFDGTYKQVMFFAVDYGAIYWWHVNVSDGENVTTATYCFTTLVINTYVDTIDPYIITTNPLTITATGDTGLDNVTLYYRYSSDNSTWDNPKYFDSIELQSAVVDNATLLLAYPQMHHIDMTDKRAYVISLFNDALTIFDISNPAVTPPKLGEYQNSAFLNGAHDVWYKNYTTYGKVCFVPTYNIPPYLTYLTSLNVTNPDAIIKMQSLRLNSSGMYLAYDDTSGYLFVSQSKYNKIAVINISNPTRMKYVINITGLLGQPWHMFFFTAPNGSRYLYSTQEYKGIYIYDITDITAITYAGALNTTDTFRAVYRYNWGGFTYLLASNGKIKGIDVFNLSSGGYISPTWILHVGANTTGPMQIRNGYVFISRELPFNGLCIYNFTNINNPSFMGGIFGAGPPNFLDGVHEIKFGNDSYLYVQGYLDNSFVTLKINWNEREWRKWVSSTNPDMEYPWSWSFDFPNGTGYYEFYSIGKKYGSAPENQPLSKDAMVHYTTYPPQADFTYSTNKLSVIFNASSSNDPDGNITAWSWDFGDGNGGAEEIVTHNYLSSGTYNVTLAVIDNDGFKDSIAKKITVEKEPESQKALIFGMITNLSNQGEYITFEAIKTRVITCKPFSFHKYVSGETCIISKDNGYLGFIGERYIFALCEIVTKT